MRLTPSELQKVKEEHGVDRLYSWSMINTFMTSPFEYYLRYVAKETGDRKDSAYAPLGGVCHDQLEAFYSNEIPYEKMLTNFEDGWDVNIELLNLKFNRSSDEQNDAIKQKYKKDIEHFFANHVPIQEPSTIEVEKFMVATIHGRVFQGYIDAIEKTEDGHYNIIDWKTSTIYQGETAKEKSGQLVLYAIGLMQSGVPINDISIGWNFLKYVTVSYPMKNGKTKVRNIERTKIGSSLRSSIKTWLKTYGYYGEDGIETVLDTIEKTNDLTCIPKDVRSLYTIKDCYVFLDLDKAFVQEWVDKIFLVIQQIESAESSYQKTHNSKVFFDVEESIDKQSYYFANLCEYSSALHEPYRDWLQKKQREAELFTDIGLSQKEEQFDLSWLDNI